MRILFATHLVPFPVDTGGKAVTSQTLDCLAAQGAVDACAFVPPWSRQDGTAQFRQAANTVTTVPLRRRPVHHGFLLAMRGGPYYVLRDESPEMAACISDLHRRGTDVLFADSLQMAGYLSRLQGRKVLQEHNVESYLVGEYFRRHWNPAIRAAGIIETRNLERFERDQCNAYDAVITLSEDDRVRLLGLGVRSRVMAIPPAVAPVDPVPDRPERRHIVHIGTGHWPPIAEGLRWYVRDVHPLVWRVLPSAETWFAGPPPRHLGRGPAAEGIKVLGYVDDLRPIYDATAVFIVPLLVGGGVRLKILHALARGLAVVSTTPGSEGLGLEPGRHLLVADDPRQFAEAVIAVATDTGLRRRLAEAGRAYVNERFRPERRCAVLASLLSEVVGHQVTLR